MPFNYDLVGACQNIIREAESLAGQNYAFNLQRKTGALDFITSEKNGRPEAELISFDQGRKIGRLLVYYDQRTKECETSTIEGSTICDPGTQPVRKEFLTEIDNYIHTQVRDFSARDMEVLCKNHMEFIRDRLFSDLRAARETLSERILANLQSYVGTNYEWDGTTTTTSKILQLLATSGSQRVPLPGNFAELLEDYQNNQLTGQPALIGQGNLAMFMKLHGMSCCNATTPYGDSNVNAEADFYMDQAANAVLGSNQFLMAAYGITHLVTFNENTLININTPLAQHIVVPDPAGYPFSWDLDFKWDECDKIWKYMYSLRWTTFNVYQEDSFSSSGDSPDQSPDCDDELLGMMGIFQYQATSA